MNEKFLWLSTKELISPDIENEKIRFEIIYLDEYTKNIKSLKIFWLKQNIYEWVINYFLSYPTNYGYRTTEIIKDSDFISFRLLDEDETLTLDDLICKEFKELSKKVKNHDLSKIDLQKYTFINWNKFDMWSWFAWIWFDCPLGWRKILKVVFDEFQEMHEKEWISVWILQIKEKFAEFRIYHSWNEKSKKISSWATYESRKTCMVCWEPWVETWETGWIFTLCNKHKKELRGKSFSLIERVLENLYN